MENFFNKALKIAKSRYKTIILVVILLIGAWLRLYHFSDWLHFELDQARDAMFISEAVTHGPLEMPILGPKASGTTLRLGPAYYYMEYASALVFGNTPVGHALFVPLFSIASLFVFYLLMKRFFNIPISLGLTYLYAISLFFILYARFSWNPNVLPFFIITLFYNLLKATDRSSAHPGRWLVLAALSFAIGTQLHFVSFLALPFLVVGFLAYKRPKFSWKAWLASAAVVATVYAPVLANEFAFRWGNTKAFFHAVSEKSGTNHPLVEKMAHNIVSESEKYAMLLSGYDRITLPDLRVRSGSLKLVCGDHCKKDSRGLAVIIFSFFVTGSVWLLWRAFRKKGDWMIIGIWFLATFLIFALLAFNLAPRFFLMAVPLPFIFLGIILEFLWKKNELVGKIALLVMLAFLSYTNLTYARERFTQLKNADSKVVRLRVADHITEELARVTLAQQKKIARYMVDSQKQNGYPVFIAAESFYRRSLKYLSEQAGASVAQLESQNVYAHGNYFVILRTTNSGKDFFRRYTQAYEIADKKEFGTLTVYSMIPKLDKITASDATRVPLINSDGGDIQRITWNDVLK